MAGTVLTGTVAVLLLTPTPISQLLVVGVGALLAAEIAGLFTPSHRFLAGAGAAAAVGTFVFTDGIAARTAVLVLGVAAMIVAGVGRADRSLSLRCMALLPVAWTYAVLSLGLLVDLLDRYDPTVAAALLVATSSRDIAANWLGRRAGGGAISRVSPRKTYRGALVGGLAAAAISFVPVHLAMPGGALWTTVAVLVIVGVGGQTGDLVGSAIKRSTGVKDSSVLLGGQGGLLDTVDSLLMTAPLTYIMLRALGGAA